MNSSYRMTEVGLLPEDWDAKRFSECFTLVRNNTYARECLTDHPGSVANVHYGDVLIKYGAVLDFAKNAVPYLKSDVKPNKDMLRDGDLVFADTAEDEAVGKAVEVQGLKSRMAVAGLHTVASRPHDGLFAQRYLGYYINSAAYHNQLLPLITGTKVSSVSRACFLSTYVAIPPKSEQRRIAGALSDVDELILALGKLIEKKRNIKTGAMQELLTGKTRLPGFGANSLRSNHSHAEAQRGRGIEFKQTELGPIPMDWEVKRFDDTFEHVPSKPFQLQSSEYRESGRFQVVDQGQMEIVGYTDDDKKLFHVPEGGVIIFGDHTRIVKFRESDFVVGADGTQLLVGKNDCTRFLFYVLQQQDIPNLGYSRHFKYVKEGRYAVPPTLAEQKAIAAVLSDMDAGIAALEAKRAKYERIKQGMMQELLTGKTRLKGE